MDASGPAGRFGVGRPVRRIEDRRLVSGQGRFTDDATLPRMAHAYVLRSPHAHARILHIEAARAKKAKGVLAVLTAAELERTGVKPIPTFTRLPTSSFPNRDGSPLPDPPYYPLTRQGALRRPSGGLRRGGNARGGAGRCRARRRRNEELDPVTDAARALGPAAPALWDELPGNLCFDTEHGDGAAVERAFAAAAHVVRLPHVNNRLIVHYMEPRVALADYDKARDFHTPRCGTQSVQRQRLVLAQVLGIVQSQIRVMAADVAAGSAPGASAIPSTYWWRWRRSARAGWSSRAPTAARTDSPTRRGATRSSTQRSRATAPGASSLCGSKRSTTSALISARSATGPRRSTSCALPPASTPHPRPTRVFAPPSPIARPPTPVAASGAQRRSTPSSGG